jgi:hypothetical protein
MPSVKWKMCWHQIGVGISSFCSIAIEGYVGITCISNWGWYIKLLLNCNWMICWHHLYIKLGLVYQASVKLQLKDMLASLVYQIGVGISSFCSIAIEGYVGITCISNWGWYIKLLFNCNWRMFIGVWYNRLQLNSKLVHVYQASVKLQF